MADGVRWPEFPTAPDWTCIYSPLVSNGDNGECEGGPVVYRMMPENHMHPKQTICAGHFATVFTVWRLSQAPRLAQGFVSTWTRVGEGADWP